MKDSWPILIQYVVPAVLGLVAGVIGSLIAPWVQWAIEKRRDRQKRQFNSGANTYSSLISTVIDMETRPRTLHSDHILGQRFGRSWSNLVPRTCLMRGVERSSTGK